MLERSKLWWDYKLTIQLKVTRKSRKDKVTEGVTREERNERWKKELKKIRRMVKEKKIKYWQKFCEKNRKKDPLEITKWAKDPWRLKGSMRKLTSQDGTELSTEKDKVQGLVKDHFGWNDNRRKVDEEEEVDNKREIAKAEEIRRWAKEALSKTSNASAVGLNGISYRFIKAIMRTELEEELIDEVTRNIQHGRILKEWQYFKVVMISKPGKNHKTTKGWRPINLINCIGKLGENVMVEKLQGAELFHRHQFGLVKGWSAVEVALQVVTRAQRCMGSRRAVRWVFGDVKGGFQNAREEDVVR